MRQRGTRREDARRSLLLPDVAALPAEMLPTCGNGFTSQGRGHGFNSPHLHDVKTPGQAEESDSVSSVLGFLVRSYAESRSTVFGTYGSVEGAWRT
jgi:hypothetical protein